MFNGVNLEGWKGDMSHWQVADSAITAKGSISSNTFLVWKTPESDFVLEADVMVPGAGEANTGIQFHSQVVDSSNTGKTPWKVCGPQADIGPQKFGALYEECTGRVVPPDSSHCQKAGTPDGWNHYELRVDGKHWNLKMNGVECFDFQDSAKSKHPAAGAVALQYHVPGFPLWFKHMRMKRINLASTAIGPAPLRRRARAYTGKAALYRWDGRRAGRSRS